MRRTIRLVLFGFGLGLAAVGRGATFTVTVAPGGTPTFSPATQTIGVGDTVHWVWAGNDHSTTSGNACTFDGGWESGVQNTGFTFDMTFPSAGTFNYYCSVHCASGMTGTIIVLPPATATPPPTPTPIPTVTFTPTPTPTPTATFTPAFTSTITPTPTPGTPRSYFSVTPCRVVDTRNPNGPYGGPALAANTDRVFIAAGQCGVPSSALAISVNLTITGPTVAGDLRLYAAGGALPVSTTISYSSGQTRADNMLAPIGNGGGVGVHCDQPSGSVQLILDVNGYFQ